MRKLYLLCVATLCTMVGVAQAPVSITSLTNVYNQNFDGSLASTGTTGSTLPVGWLFSESGMNANTTYGVDNGGSNSGNTNSYGATGSTERAFGGLLSGSLTPTIGVGFTNNSGSTITSIAVNYYGERWRLGTQNRVDSLIFQYSLNATSLTTGTFTTINQLSYGAPASTATVGALDGNAAANRTNIVFTITGLSIPAGATFYFRWNDLNVSGNDDGLAIDDFVINFNGSTLPNCVTPTAQPGALSFTNVTTNSFTISFAAANPAPDEYLAVISTSNTLGAIPLDGTVYNTDDVIGNGSVIYRGSGTSFSGTNLTSGTTYYLYIFSVNSNCSNGPDYLTANPATGSQATATPPVCVAPAGQISNVVFSTVTGNSINGSFNTVADADGYLAVVSTNSNVGFTPVNGTAYTVGSTVGNGRVIKYSSGNTFSATSLTPATTYYFTFYALNGFNCTSGPVYNATAVNASTATNNNTSGIPTGYYDTVTTQICAALKSVLKYRTITGHTPRTYGDLWTQYLVSDIKPREVGPGTSSTVIWDVYSDNPTGTDPYNFTPGPVPTGQQDNGGAANSEGILYNREHSVPLSWFSGNTGNPGPATDYMHLFPTDKYVNALRGSYIYGEISNPTNTTLNGSKLGPNAFAGLSGIGFEPINEFKGDLARGFLYFVTRYEDNMSGYTASSLGNQAFEPNTYPSVDIPYLQLMMKWHMQDPVSQKEIDRNNAAYTYQGNRNPYIDHPEYVDLVWGNSCFALPVQLVSFKGTLRGNIVTLNWEVKNESNLVQYEVERSDNNQYFTKIGSVKATNRSSYQFGDDISQLTGRRLYYRLKRVDADGKFVYSDVFTVHVPLNLQFSVYPNPVTNGLVNVQLAKPASTKGYLQLTDATGKTYQQTPISVGTTNITLNVKALTPGMYVLRLVQQTGNVVVQKVQVL
jgi:endonuclease I